MALRVSSNDKICKLSVLIFDESVYMQGLIRSMLDQVDGVTNIEMASSADEAFEKLIIFQPDILITDCNSDFVKRVRRNSESPTHEIPIIMLTGYAELPLILEARDAGVNEFLAKPTSGKRLHSRIAAVVRKPRPFVHSVSYLGPDRRRQDAGPPEGTEERRQEASGQ